MVWGTPHKRLRTTLLKLNPYTVGGGLINSVFLAYSQFDSLHFKGDVIALKI